MESSAENTTEVKDAGLVLPEIEGLPTIARHGLGGAAIGGGAAALLGLLHQIKMERMLNKEEREAREPKEDENTIVLSLPAKEASDPGTFAAAWLAALGGGAGTYQLVRKLYHQNLLKDLESREDAAREEVLDQLMSSGEKTADAQEVFSPVDKAMGFATLLTLLGAGTTGYLTKKVLDAKFRATDREKYEPPEVQKVIFRSEPLEAETDEEKEASADELDAVRTLVVLHAVKAANDYSVFEEDAVKEAMAADGLDKEALVGMTSNPIVAATMAQLLENEATREAIQKAYMRNHPSLKYFQWAVGAPGAGRVVDYFTDRKMNKMFPPPVDLDQLSVAEAAGLPKPTMLQSLSYEMRNNPTLKNINEGRFSELFGKSAFISGSGIANSLVGSLVAENVDEEQGEAAAAETESAPDIDEMVSNIALSAEDDAAREYLQENEERIREILRQVL